MMAMMMKMGDDDDVLARTLQDARTLRSQDAQNRMDGQYIAPRMQVL